jgi:hypothetical protein
LRRHENGRPQQTQAFCGNSLFFTCFGIRQPDHFFMITLCCGLRIRDGDGNIGMEMATGAEMARRVAVSGRL